MFGYVQLYVSFVCRPRSF